MKISLLGKTKNVRFSVKLNANLDVSTDWIIKIEVFSDSKPIPNKDMNIFYSSALDCNFFGVPEKQESDWLRLKELESSVPFDSLVLSLVKLPWAKSAQGDSEVVLEEVQYSAKSVHLASNLQPIHIRGTI